ncbi:MAG: excinuclease ABC subunit UvrA [Verrucomicrobia bacterium]|nr:excinuclease ABC subunit UvrA [Verrucomicrobiota bacterium]
MGQEWIRIGGAREHNLKNVSLNVPRNRLVVFTGLSGSGKSSLAFDTIFAEGRRKYVESLSSYARQFLDQMQKPDVDFIEGLSPAIAIEQRGSAANPRSTIATTTEIYDYLRLLFANVAQPYCPDSGNPIYHQTTTDIVDEVMKLSERTRVMVLAPIDIQKTETLKPSLERLAREGFVRVRIDGAFHELGALSPDVLEAGVSESLEVVVDRLVVQDKVRVRLADSVETALRWGDGIVKLLYQKPEDRARALWEESTRSNRLYSPETGRTYERLEAKHFSFNSLSGACEACHGLGQQMEFDPELIIPDTKKTLEQGAVLPFYKVPKAQIALYDAMIKGLSSHYKQSMDAPFKNLKAAFKETLLHGSGEELISFQTGAGATRRVHKRAFEGLIPMLERQFEESESESSRNRLKAYMSPIACESCHGLRLRPEILSATLGNLALFEKSKFKKLAFPDIPGLSIMDICHLTIEQLQEFFEHLELDEFQHKIAGDLVQEILTRLKFLNEVGLGYLSLDRESGTLSGGEAQRIRLATQIGGGLVGVLYILDEPSIGLHQRDNDRLLETLIRLRDLGNSVLVVEHDEDTIRRADYVVDMGPGAGVNGGDVVAYGTVDDILGSERSFTGKYLSGVFSIDVPSNRIIPTPDKGYLTIKGATENNLKNIDVRIPLGLLTCVTGVSGSGKSTLIDGILRKTLMRKWYGAKDRPGKHQAIYGDEKFSKIIVMNQSPIGRTPRSNPATYTGIFNQIRDLFARLPSARIRGYESSRFSFNVKGGRCEKCQGDGLIKIEMHFLPAVYVTCEACYGKRYNRETLEINYKGRTIADVLDMTIDEAATFFRAVPKICEPCLTLAEVGLGYLRLGQSATTLSGGEAQRVKLAAELGKRTSGRTLYIFDEPTTGLHFHDVATLLSVMNRLRQAGNTLVVIEHNLDVIKTADWVIDLGPEGGSGGGEIVAEGTPEDVSQVELSHTGKYLKSMLT